MGIPERRGAYRLWRWGFIAVALVGACCVGWGFLIEPKQLVLHRERVHLDGLPPMRIVVLGDLHGGAHFIDRASSCSPTM